MTDETTDRPSNKMTDRDKAWVAGFLEGRGKLLYDRKSRSIRIRMSGLDSYQLEEFKFTSRCWRMPLHNGTVTISGRWAVRLLVEIFEMTSLRFQVNIREYVLLWNESPAGHRHPFTLPAEPIIHP